jgi:hypothetical protein
MIDVAGRRRRDLAGHLEADLADRLHVDLLDEERVAAASRMATVYTALAAFENTVRDLVTRTMLEGHGADWWNTVNSSVRKRSENRRAEEEKHKFHTQRGDDLINYTELGDLLNVIRANEGMFEAAIPSADWAKSIFDAVTRSRNVIMHSGSLSTADIERVGINIRDWVTQVGA